MCISNVSKEKFKELGDYIEKNDLRENDLIAVLHKAQELFGYLGEEVQLFVSEKLEVPVSKVYGVITFYSRFTLKPKGKYHIAICLGTACYVKGSEKILDRVKERLGIEVGETTKDGKYSLEATRCIGACGLAPVFTVNDEVYGKATPEMIEKVIKEYQAKE